MAQKQTNIRLWSERWPAPAKLNLMLRITGRRDDGYHLLQTVFQFIDLCDWLVFHPNIEGSIDLLKPTPGVLVAEDLTIKAANLLRQETGCTQGVTIELVKNLPMGGGLGGGSSDAATTLVVLNKLWELDLPVEKLMQLGLSLGADVPIFIYGHAAWAEGVGEKLERVTVPEQWCVVIRPDCHVNTREIFCDPDLTRNSKSITIADFLAGQHQNDCLDVVVQRHAPVRGALQALSNFAGARLTGTGACVFALFDSENAALKAYESLKDSWDVFLSKGMNESPLQTKLSIGS
ncbi:MAG: 4-(cytidine 5'-diphospho)-2-C-methyl-D-erythritol kinase [Methylococcaceae bacterium]|jgi:4-diphosphocytidyl-2-C-methyl-D-erythritol kinase